MDPVSKKYYCVCCGYATLEEQGGIGSYEICKVCDWEDDGVQFKDPDFNGGANEPSLNQAKKNFQQCGAIEESAMKRVEAPGDRARDPNYVEPQ